MLFAAFTAALAERRAGPDWKPFVLPGLLWVNTVVLVASSVTLEAARRKHRAIWLRVSLGLGLLFLAGQLAAWGQMRAAGLFLATQPYASFVYTLTAVHGVHLIGGLIALWSAARRPAAFGLCVGFWHFMGAVWLYVLAVLQILR